MKTKFVSGLLSLGMGLLVTGCVNHVSDYTDVTKNVERSEVSRKYYVTLNPAEPTDTSFEVTIEKTVNYEKKSYEITVGKRSYVPYSGWRQLYEMPAGLGLLPCSILSHVGWLCCLGLWDYDFTWDITCKSFSGMNPFINWETEAGTVEEVISAEKKLVKTEPEVKKSLLSKRPVTLKAGTLSKTYVTDEFGTFNVYLLSLKPEEIFFPLDRQISFFPEEEKTSAKEVVLERKFVTNLLSARDRINDYMLAQTGESLVETLSYLEELGFAKIAYELEKRELKKHENDEHFIRDFRKHGGEL